MGEENKNQSYSLKPLASEIQSLGLSSWISLNFNFFSANLIWVHLNSFIWKTLQIKNLGIQIKPSNFWKCKHLFLLRVEKTFSRQAGSFSTSMQTNLQPETSLLYQQVI